MGHYKLIIFDMDGVIFKHKNFWMQLHKAIGTYSKGKELTDKYLRTDYPKLVDEVVGKLWKGKDAQPYYELIKTLEYKDGADEVLKKLRAKGYKTGIITSGPHHAAIRVQKECGLDYYHAHELLIGTDGKFSGHYKWDTGHLDKTRRLKQFAEETGCSIEETIFIGHDHNDISSLKAAGLGIAIKPENEEVAKEADIITDDIKKIPEIIEEQERKQQ